MTPKELEIFEGLNEGLEFMRDNKPMIIKRVGENIILFNKVSDTKVNVNQKVFEPKVFKTIGDLEKVVFIKEFTFDIVPFSQADYDNNKDLQEVIINISEQIIGGVNMQATILNRMYLLPDMPEYIVKAVIERLKNSDILKD